MIFLKKNPDLIILTSIAPVLKNGQTKQVEFFQHLNQPYISCPGPQFLIDQIFVQLLSLVPDTEQIPDHTYKVASST